MCINYRRLNNVRMKNKYSIPRIYDLIDQIQGAHHFSKIDLKFGYHQLKVRNIDISKTTFKTMFGHYKFVVMSYGITNSLPSFMDLTNKVSKQYLDLLLNVFTVYIFIYY